MTWNESIAALPDAHLLQTSEWAQVKQQTGWRSLPLVWTQSGDGAPVLSVGDREVWPANPCAAAMLLERELPLKGFAARLRLLYIPKGPLMDWGRPELRRQVLDDLAALARKRRAIFLKIDPDVRLGIGLYGQPGAENDPLGAAVTRDLFERGWHYSPEQIQFRNTVEIDLRVGEDALLAAMKPKTRYNLRLAGRKGVTVRRGTPGDLPMLYEMYARTSIRDGFVIRSQAYYLTTWQTLFDAGLGQALIAEVEGEPVAAVLVFYFAGRAWYVYGMSSDQHREKMPNYLLQWEAMRLAREHGCHTYDLWGAPETFDESDPLWGVYRFKEGLGGRVVRTLGAWDLPVQPRLYHLYTVTLPHLLDLMRRRGRKKTERSVPLVGAQR